MTCFTFYVSRNMTCFSSFYDVLLRPLDALGLRNVRQRIINPARGLVLEVGAGTGLNFEHYAPGVRVVAIEPDAEMLAQAREKLTSSMVLVQASAEALPFPDQVFDEATATLVFCTVPDAAQGLRETQRVLKANGYLRLLEHVRAPQRPIAALQKFVQPVWYHLADGCHLDRDTLSAVRQSGFEVMKLRRLMGGSLLEIVGRKAISG